MAEKERKQPVETGTQERAKAPACSVTFCPICVAVTALGDARPDIVEHLLLAARETLLAVQALIDVRLDGTDRPPGQTRVQRITID